MSKNVLILGASGKIGRHSAQAFETAGWSVRRYDRENDDMIKAAKNCAVIVNGLNPPNYHDWQTIIPRITNEVIRAAHSNDATVLLPGNVYHFGNQPGLWSETTPSKPVSQKGEIRLSMERTYAKSDVQTIVLRAGNLIDPECQGCVMSQIYLRNIRRDKILLPGQEETRQAMCYVPDWARAAVELAEQRETLSSFEDVPFAGHTLSAVDIKLGVEAVLGRKTKFVPFPWLIFRLSAPFSELARGMCEMRYLWNTDHALSKFRLTQLLTDFEVTPLENVLQNVLRNKIA